MRVCAGCGGEFRGCCVSVSELMAERSALRQIAALSPGCTASADEAIEIARGVLRLDDAWEGHPPSDICATAGCEEFHTAGSGLCMGCCESLEPEPTDCCDAWPKCGHDIDDDPSDPGCE